MSKSGSNAIKRHAEQVHDHMAVGEVENGLASALSGLDTLRKLSRDSGHQEAVDAAVAAGADKPTARDLVALAVLERTPPRPMMDAIANANFKERILEVKLAICSDETSKWVDLQLKDENEEAIATRDLLASAQKEKNQFKCFLLTACIVTRANRAEFIGKMGLYLMSQAFEEDLSVFRSGRQAELSYDTVCNMFGSVEKIRSGAATKDEAALFIDALENRIENALNLRLGMGYGRVQAGPDGVAPLVSEGDVAELGIMYATANDSDEKSRSTANSMDRHWAKHQGMSDVIRIMYVAKPVVQFNIDRAGWENKPLTPIAGPVATLQAAAAIFHTSAQNNIVQDMLDGKVVVEGLFFGSQQPFVLGTDIFEKTKEALLEVGRLLEQHRDGYPPDTGMGREAWSVVVNIINSWVTMHPEHFDYFQDKKLEGWLLSCPLKKNQNIFQQTSNVLNAVKNSKDSAVTVKHSLLANIPKPPECELPSMNALTLEKALELKGFKPKSASYRAAMAVAHSGDAAGVEKIKEGANPRRVRKEALKKQGAGI